MVCDNALNRSCLCLEQDGVPAAAARNVVSRRRSRRPNPVEAHQGAIPTSPPPDVTSIIEGRRAVYEATEVCPDCGAIKDRLAPCPRCAGSGEVSSDALPGPLRARMSAERITADELAEMVSRGEGTLDIVRAFPGVAERLDDQGRRSLFDAARRQPMMAMLGRTPDALVEAGGSDVLAQVAEAKPRLARRSLRTAAILGLD